MDKINFYNLISAIAISIDIGESSRMVEENVVENTTNLNYAKHKFTNHTKRVCYVSTEIGKIISNDKEFLKDLYVSSALHDIGISSNITDAHTEPDFIKLHCTKGSEFCLRLNFGESISTIIKYHHENYDGTSVFNIKGNDIPLISQIIRLADIFELLYDESVPNYLQRNSINKWILENKYTIFNSDIVDVYMDLQSHDKFWWDVENVGYIDKVLKNIRPKEELMMDMKGLKSISEVLADIIDSKSDFTYRHSSNLAEIISKIADYLNFDENKKTRFIVSALLHDIGKMGVPNSILNKNGKLNPTEITIMKSHTYYTRIILSQIEGIEDITNWASNHHEKLDGSGYPIGLKGKDLSLEERILAVCDIYEALSSKRPYKKALSKDEIFNIMNPMVTSGKICGQSLDILKEVI